MLESQEEREKKENPHHSAELFVDSKGTLIYWVGQYIISYGKASATFLANPVPYPTRQGWVV